MDVLAPVNQNVYLIYYGFQNQQDPKCAKTQAIVNGFIKSISGSDWWKLSTEYYQLEDDGNRTYVSGKVNFANGPDGWSDPGSQSLDLVGDNGVDTIVSNNIYRQQKGVADPDGFYIVVTAPGVRQGSDDQGYFCQDWCGWHSHGELTEYTSVLLQHPIPWCHESSRSPALSG